MTLRRPQRTASDRSRSEFKPPGLIHTYAGSLVFLSITASLFAEALGSLGVDDPVYSYRIHTDGPAVNGNGFKEPSPIRRDEPPSNLAAAGCAENLADSASAELPDQIFAPLPSSRVDFSTAPPSELDRFEAAADDSRARGAAGVPERIKVRDRHDRVMVARLHGRCGGESRFLLPDGQLGIPTRLVPTDEPFRPTSFEELRSRLKSGEFAEFESIQTSHYLIFFQENGDSSRRFAEQSGELLENLYKGLTDTFQKRGIPVHDLEFPLVVVIFESERAFRAHKKVDPDIQAYYEIYTNRIYFYQTSERDQLAPELAILRRPQTVAHEGTHQILANIGVQPRLGAWPAWLTEGLAEYCASPVQDKRGSADWNGLGMINALHMATIRDLEDPLAMHVKSRQDRSARTGRDPGKPLLESLIRADRLAPTDYALAWALTHYLALKRGDDFVDFLVEMGKTPPLEVRTPDDHVAAFKRSFGPDLARLDKQIAGYLVKLSRQRGYDHLPYYAVKFEQPFGNGVLRRASMVSQSPSMIQQWIQEVSSSRGGTPAWRLDAHMSRSRAVRAAEEFMEGY